MRKLLVVVLLSLILAPLASIAFAQDHGATPATETQPAAPANNNSVVIWKALGAALAIGISALATAWAQSRIGSAAAGAMAEKPEIGGVMIVLEALPETIIILGFVIAIMIVGIK